MKKKIFHSVMGLITGFAGGMTIQEEGVASGAYFLAFFFGLCVIIMSILNNKQERINQMIIESFKENHKEE